MPAPVCRFFQQGKCKFGSNCRFEHPTGGNRNVGSDAGTGQNALLDKYSISHEVIEKDLTTEAPQWILSAYAPGRNPPDQLFGGFPREQSFEEMRFLYYTAKLSGTEQQALNEAQELYQNAQQQMQNAARNPRDAANFILQADSRHPNRNDMNEQMSKGHPFGVFRVGNDKNSTSNPFGSNSTTQQTQSPFGGGTSSGGSTFGQPSALGQRPSAFGAPAFGQPSQPSTSAFGQPSTSAFGQPSKPAFGQPSFGQPSQPQSAFGQPSKPAAPAFGQPSQPGSTSTFGQPSQLGSTSAFGQPSKPGPTSAFGQPSALGAKPNPFGTPAFGQPSQPNSQGSAFGQPSQLGQNKSPFASSGSPSPFGSAAPATNNNAASSPFSSSSNAPGTAASPFGTSGANNNAQNNQSPFGQTTASASPFGQPSASPANPFASANQSSNTPAASNPFAQKSDQPSGFAAVGSQPQQQNGGFNQPAGNANPFGQSNNTASPFGQPSQTANPFGSAQSQQPAASAATAGTNTSPYPPGSSKQHPPLESYSAKGMDGRLSNFKGKPVTYKGDAPGIRGFDGTWSRIWFPNGPPGYNKDTELPPEAYDDKSKIQWAAFAEKEIFVDGLMPELPPPRDVTTWDF